MTTFMRAPRNRDATKVVPPEEMCKLALSLSGWC
jgi:hypothetical protein